MSERIWDRFLTEEDKEVFAVSGWGARAGYGKRPALLVVDVNYAFCGDKPEPILESIKRWRNSCGPARPGLKSRKLPASGTPPPTCSFRPDKSG